MNLKALLVQSGDPGKRRMPVYCRTLSKCHRGILPVRILLVFLVLYVFVQCGSTGIWWKYITRKWPFPLQLAMCIISTLCLSKTGQNCQGDRKKSGRSTELLVSCLEWESQSQKSKSKTYVEAFLAAGLRPMDVYGCVFRLFLPLAGHSRWVWDCVFSVDAAYLVTASSDCTARLWDLASGETIRTYSGHAKAAVCCALNDSAIEGRDQE